MADDSAHAAAAARDRVAAAVAAHVAFAARSGYAVASVTAIVEAIRAGARNTRLEPLAGSLVDVVAEFRAATDARFAALSLSPGLLPERRSEPEEGPVQTGLFQRDR